MVFLRKFFLPTCPEAVWKRNLVAFIDWTIFSHKVFFSNQLIFVGDQLIFFRKSAVTTEFLTFFLGVLIFFVISHPMAIICPVNLDIFSADSMTFSVYSMTFFMRFKFFSPV